MSEKKRMKVLIAVCFCLGAGIVRAEEVSTQAVKQGWVKEKDRLICYDKKGKVLKEIKFEDKLTYYDAQGKIVKEVSPHSYAEHWRLEYSSYTSHKVSGGATTNRKYAWLQTKNDMGTKSKIFRDWDFQYFDQNGNLLWEKPKNVENVQVSENGKIILLTESNPKHFNAWIEVDEAEAEFLELRFDKVYDSSGNLLFNIFDEGCWYGSSYLSKSGKYGAVKCSKTTIFFNTEKKTKKVMEGTGVVELSEDGSFKVTRPYQELDPETKKYGPVKHRVLHEGKVE